MHKVFYVCSRTIDVNTQFIASVFDKKYIYASRPFGNLELAE
jgi:hypothetical protein